jgi:hypothetical protein
MRPKGSDRNKAIAAGIASIAVQYSESGTDFICCHGAHSIYSFFAALLPNCSRDAQGEEYANPGVSRIEMNKILVKAGYQVFRKRELAPGTTDQLKRGCRRWKYCRWTNPEVHGELEEINMKLQALQSEFSETSSLSLKTFCQQLTLFRSGSSSGLDLQCENTDEESPEQPCELVSDSQLKLPMPPSKYFKQPNPDLQLSTGSHHTQMMFGRFTSDNEAFFATMQEFFTLKAAAYDTAGLRRREFKAIENIVI